MTCVEVAVAAPLARPLTYLWPGRWPVGPRPGQRLLVPLGRRKVTGYCLGETEESAGGGKLKEVAEVLTNEPLFSSSLIPFLQWVADYYHHPIGKVIEEALPGGLTMKTGQRLVLTEKGRQHLLVSPDQDGNDFSWMQDLLVKGDLPPAAARMLLRSEAGRKIAQLQRQGFVILQQELTGRQVRPRTEAVIRLLQKADSVVSALQSLKKSEKKTLAILEGLLAGQCCRKVPRRLITAEYSGAGKALKSLAEKGFIAVEEQRVFRDPFGLEPPYYPRPQHLMEEQQVALDAILPCIDEKRFTPFLLHGITGSGKTEVYLRAAEETISQGRGVMVLVPEIALATQLEGHFYSRFGDLTALLHSGLSPGERLDQWQRLADGHAKVVVGARSAVFAPLADPGLIIVDEEHDGAYKQEEGLRYQARDLAVLRGKMQQAVVLLGSASPSVVSFMHARQGKYRRLAMNRRVEDRPLPQVSIVDLKKEEGKEGGRPLFSPQLTAALRENLDNREQSLLFLNRRGFASLLICRDCGNPVQCRNCQISLTLHKGTNRLVCHHCGYSINAATICEHCRGSNLFSVGFGTERLEEELSTILPDARIARLDRDSVVKRRDFYAILNKVRKHEVDILVGTQMITKGHHFPAVTLVGIVWADAGLGMPDYKAGERTFQLLSQVMGRAGRGERKGRVIVQTYQPDHYSIRCAQQHDYGAFFEQEIQLRGALKYPPFSRLINVLFDGPEEKSVKLAAMEAGHLLQDFSRANGPLQVLGPAPLLRLGGRFRWQVLLSGASVEKLHGACHRLLSASPSAVRSRHIRMHIDVDPEGML
jgi:primosomal protein N' (replication factor Y)